MTAPELKPCPFCGGRNVGWEWVSTYSTDSSYAFFGCLDCRIGSNEADEDNTMHPADVSAWNTRAPDPDLKTHIGAVLAEAANTCGKNNGPWRSSAWECREAILALHPTTLTALDRAIEAAILENNENNEDWFGVVHDLWGWILDQPGGLDAPIQEGSADAVLENFKTTISAMLREARVEGLKEAADMVAAYENKRAWSDWASLHANICALIKKEESPQP